MQLQINILPSCITLVLLYILTYDAQKPKHETGSKSPSTKTNGQSFLRRPGSTRGCRANDDDDDDDDLFSTKLIYLLVCILCGDIVSITDYTGWNFTIMNGQFTGKYVDGCGLCRFQGTTLSFASYDEENHERIQWR